MHDSRFYENEKKHEVAIFENKRARGRPKGKGYMVATTLLEDDEGKSLLRGDCLENCCLATSNLYILSHNKV